MAFNAPTHRDYLHLLRNYIAAPAFLSRVGWGQNGSANVLVDKQNREPTVLIVVGKVVHDRVFCGPSGNWSMNNKFGSLKEAKYQFSIGRPDEDVFMKEFNAAFKTLGKVQSGIALTQERSHLLVGENDKVNSIRFSANVFEEREIVSISLHVVYIYAHRLRSQSRFRRPRIKTLLDFRILSTYQILRLRLLLMRLMTPRLLTTHWTIQKFLQLLVSHYLCQIMLVPKFIIRQFRRAPVG
jgi:hypothetical protein